MNPIFKKNAINFGIISGLIGITATTLMYLIDLKLFINLWVGGGMLLIWLVIGIVLLSKSKKENQGILSFKDAFTTYFLSAVIGILISTAFNMFLFNFFDTDARDKITEHAIEFNVQISEKYNVPQDQIAKQVEELEKNAQFGLKTQALGIVYSMFGAAIFGLILAAFLKSKNKEVY